MGYEFPMGTGFTRVKSQEQLDLSKGRQVQHQNSSFFYPVTYLINI